MSPNTEFSLPPPDSAGRARIGEVTRCVREVIAERGPIDFSRFMELVLYAPGIGYYVAGAHKFGAGGDFVTAPELGNLFARCVARQVAQVLDDIGGGDILEFGAGSGALAADLLGELAALGRLPRRYLIVEVSAELRQRQRLRLAAQVPRLADRVHWVERWPEDAAVSDAGDFNGIVLANEVLDAMPVTRFAIEKGRVRRVCVDWDGSGWVEVTCEADAPWAEEIAQLGLPDGYTSEVGLEARAWVRSLGSFLKRGAALLIDYGFPGREYYHPQRSQGTLMCHYRHRAHSDPYVLLGLQDLTAHVDFTAIAAAAESAELEVLGFTELADFLLALGLTDLMPAVDRGDVQTYRKLTQEVTTLTMPHEMGALFKVMALGRGIAGPLKGFSQRDHRIRL